METEINPMVSEIRPVQHAAHHVPAELVAAEHEARAGRLQRVARRGLDRVTRAQPRRAQGHERERAQDDEAHDGATLSRELARALHATRIRGSTKA